MNFQVWILYLGVLKNLLLVAQVGGARVNYQDSQVGGSEGIAKIRGSEHSNAAQSTLQSFMGSAGQSMNYQQNSYQNRNALHGSHQNMNAQQSYQGSHQNLNAQQSPYQLSGQPGSYPNVSVPQAAYHNISAYQGYQY